MRLLRFARNDVSFAMTLMPGYFMVLLILSAADDLLPMAGTNVPILPRPYFGMLL